MIRSLLIQPRHSTLLWIAALPVLYLISRYNYNLFHGLVDGISITIAASVFMIIWNGRRILDNDYFLYIGISFLFFAFLDFMHVLGNKNMGVFPEYGNLGPALYIATRYILSISLLIAPLFIKRKLNSLLMFAIYSLVTLFVLLSIFYWKIFPVCIVEGVGLTPFKVISDYIICFILLGAIGLLLINRRSFDSSVFLRVVSSIILFIATGVAFTLYADPFGVMNAVGHFLQIASFYIVYLAIIESSITKPQDVLYRKLKQSEEELAAKVRHLDHANLELRQEINERRRMEEALRESEERHRLISEASADIIWVLDVESKRFKYVSPSITRLRGYTQEEALAQPFGSALTPESAKRTNELLAARVSQFLSGKPMPLHFMDEMDQLRKDGSIIHTEVTTNYLLNMQGKLEVVGVTRDVSDRKRAEEALRESEERHRSIFENSLDGIILSFPNGQILAANPSACRMHGYTEEEMRLLGREGITDQSDLRLRQQIEERSRTGRWRGEIIHIRKDGTRFPCETSTAIFRDKQGRESSVVIIRDITDRRLAEEALRKAHDEMELRVKERTAELVRKNQELQEFAFVASHDLNEPLRKIQAFGSLLEAKSADRLDAEQRNYISRITGAANRMQELLGGSA